MSQWNGLASRDMDETRPRSRVRIGRCLHLITLGPVRRVEEQLRLATVAGELKAHILRNRRSVSGVGCFLVQVIAGRGQFDRITEIEAKVTYGLTMSGFNDVKVVTF